MYPTSQNTKLLSLRMTSSVKMHAQGSKTGEKEEVWRGNVVTSEGEMNDNEEVYKSIKPVLSYEKFYYPDGVTLYSEKWTYDEYAPFPFGFHPFATDEKKEEYYRETKGQLVYGHCSRRGY
ncbi:hypothetical protein Tco_0807646 [Tanacetum coccineum]